MNLQLEVLFCFLLEYYMLTDRTLDFFLVKTNFYVSSNRKVKFSYEEEVKEI